MLEPYDGKLSRTVLREEGSRKAPALPGATNGIGVLEEKKKQEDYIWVFGLVLLVGVILFVALHNTSTSAQTVKGTVVSFESVPTDDGTQIKLQIKLETGKTVSVSIESSLPYRTNAKVQLEETKSIIGTTGYRFIGYL